MTIRTLLFLILFSVSSEAFSASQDEVDSVKARLITFLKAKASKYTIPAPESLIESFINVNAS